MTPIDRRAVLQMIAGGAAATLAGCRGPDQTIYPMVDQPEGTHPGVVRRYATALPLAGYLRGVTGLVVDSRPIKLEGLAAHPASLGATDLFTETAILDLYDPQRQKVVQGPDGPSSWPTLGRRLYEAARATRGEGVVLLTGRVTSPTLLGGIAGARARLPGLRHVRWEPLNDDAPLAAATAAFGRPLLARPRLDTADVVLLLGADPLGPGSMQVANAAAWATRRRGGRTRLYAAEASPSASGIMADRRVAASPADLAALCHDLAHRIGGAGEPPALPPALAAFAQAVARDLTAARGRALVIAGDHQPREVHIFAAWLNGVLNAPVDWIAPVDPDPTPQGTGLAALASDMHAGRVRALIVLDSNPAYSAPPGLAFAAAMAHVPLIVVAGRFPDETSSRATWTAPLAHPLESWHDGRAPDGTASIAQPLVRPFHDSRTADEVVALLTDPNGGTDTYTTLRRQWAALGDDGWRNAVATGVLPGTRTAPERVEQAPLVLPPIRPARGLAIDLRPSPTLYDGRSATNAWAQECPDPMTKEVWGSSVRLNADDMARLAVTNGDLVRLVSAHGAVTLPARTVAGQALGVATLLTGYGRSASGAVADGIGANAFVLGDSAMITRAEGHIAVPTTQHHFALDGDLAKLFPVVAPGAALPRQPDRLPSLLPNPPAKGAPPQWAMAIDTDLCIGCNACVVACQAENNVPAIGPDEIARGRDMHWLRIDRYAHDAGGGFQPVPCMQCETAPCEPVCPVEASVHDAQGLNVQVYNRCVGTRTCQANCPYKVRRFNFRDYAGASLWGNADDASITAQRNPDVTVRARGVMEKCTYCVQRIEAHTREADAGGTPAPVVTACQAACPTRAIAFGPLDGADIAAARADPRHYALLEELGTRPRTTYLARQRDEGAD